MSIETITTLISTVGFPIVAFLLVGYCAYKMFTYMLTKHTENIKVMTESYDRNTQAINSMSDNIVKLTETITRLVDRVDKVA